MDRTLERMRQLVWMLVVTGWMYFHLASAQEADGERVYYVRAHIRTVYKVFADRTIDTAKTIYNATCMRRVILVYMYKLTLMF
jgi:hypothetical protein